jgi:hypothetical protein
MHKLIDFICEEIDELERKIDKGGKLSMSEIQYLDTLAHTKKNLLKAEEMSEDGYSGMMYPRNDGRSYRYDDGRSYNDGRSYARKRDSMGRYSRGYSMASEDMVDELHTLMQNAPDEQTKREFQKFISKIESM